MAVRSTENLPSGLNHSHIIPSRTRVVMRVLKETCDFAKSNPQKIQITRELEIVSPEVLELNGQNVVVAGIKLKQYQGIRLNKPDGSRDDSQSDVLLGRYRDQLKTLELPFAEIDDEKPELLMEGMFVDVNIGSEEYDRTAALTAEEKAAGVKQGKPTGEKGYKPRIEFIIAKSAHGVGQVS